jgi:hypothetical protein
MKFRTAFALIVLMIGKEIHGTAARTFGEKTRNDTRLKIYKAVVTFMLHTVVKNT